MTSNVPQQRRKQKNVINIGTWNVRTMNKVGKLELLLDELRNLQLHVVRLCEVRWSGEGHFHSGQDLIIYSGGTN